MGGSHNGWLRSAVRCRVSLPLLCVLLLLAAAAPGRAGGQQKQGLGSSITGRVLDLVDNSPLIGAEVGLEGTPMRAITDEDGAFDLPDVPGGAQILWARRFGYQERSDSIYVPPGALLEVTVILSTEAIEMEELRVVVRSPALMMRGFYGRQAQGYGASYIDRAEIERRNPHSVTALFRNLPGVRVVWGGISGSRVFFNQRVTFADDGLPGCEPGLWLDGIRSSMRNYDLMRADEIEGIEVYAGGSAPGKFVDICGTVVIWTRLPVR